MYAIAAARQKRNGGRHLFGEKLVTQMHLGMAIRHRVTEISSYEQQQRMAARARRRAYGGAAERGT